MMLYRDSILSHCDSGLPKVPPQRPDAGHLRNFRDKDFILKQLDAMAAVKMSTLHLHLTDDAGWRIQIDAYPELTRKAAWRVGRLTRNGLPEGRNIPWKALRSHREAI